MNESPPSPLPPSRSSSSSPFNHASLSSSNVIPVSKAKPKSKSKSKPKKKPKPKHKKGKNPDMVALDKTHLESIRRRSSVYKGVTRHRWTGRFEAHLWDKNWQNPIRKKRGRQGREDQQH